MNELQTGLNARFKAAAAMPDMGEIPEEAVKGLRRGGRTVPKLVLHTGLYMVILTTQDDEWNCSYRTEELLLDYIRAFYRAKEAEGSSWYIYGIYDDRGKPVEVRTETVYSFKDASGREHTNRGDSSCSVI